MGTMNARDSGYRAVWLELERRGAVSIVEESGEELSAIRFNSTAGERFEVFTQSRTKTTWHIEIDRDMEMQHPADDHQFWIFVNLAASPAGFYVVPSWWMQNNIYQEHFYEHWALNDGYRMRKRGGQHHEIQEYRIEQWKSRWDLLGLDTLE